MSRRKKVTDKQLIEALRKSGGIISLASREIERQWGISITQSGISHRIAKDPKLQEEIKEITETVKDLAESKLIKAINRGSLTAIIFYLKTKAKDRGYNERQEISGPDGKAPVIANVSPKVQIYLPENGRDKNSIKGNE